MDAQAGGVAPAPSLLVGRSCCLLVGVALAVTFLVRLLVVQAFYIPSGSMEPTLHVGDRVLVSKLSYHLGDIHRGDVVVFDGRGSFAHRRRWERRRRRCAGGHRALRGRVPGRGAVGS